jgi:superfamily II DNA helicase RecQ
VSSSFIVIFAVMLMVTIYGNAYGNIYGNLIPFWTFGSFIVIFTVIQSFWRVDYIYRQSGHGRRVAQAHYAIDGAFLHRLGPELITAFEQASVAWHRLFELKSVGKGKGKAATAATTTAATATVGHRREASQQLTSQLAKRERIEPSVDRALVGLQRIYQDPNAKPRSEGQASALQLVHNPSPKVPLIIVLPTSSGKSALFFSVAAMAQQQTVIVVVPFAALVDDIVARGQAARLRCEEWKDGKSGHELQQLIVVSADQAVQGKFLHYAQGLALSGQLAHMFFDECHVAFTDTSYRKRLRELWTLRYLDCPFTGLTATLIVALEDVLRERLSIPNAMIFRRSTMRRTIRYQIVDSKNMLTSTMATQFVQQLQLPNRKRGVTYVRDYQTGRIISEALQCPFYNATADDKVEVLEEWKRMGGWIVATGALGTGINIEGIIYVIHVDRPYGLTSFVQQSGRGGRNGEVSDSIIIVKVQNCHDWRGQRKKEILSAYSVEEVDEEAMTAFILAKTCRRKVLSQYMDKSSQEGGAMDCIGTDSIYCDQCKVTNRPRGDIKQITDIGQQVEEQVGAQVEQQVRQQPRQRPGPNARRKARRKARQQAELQAELQAEPQTEPPQPNGRYFIGQQLKAQQESYEAMIKVMDWLQGQCIYCTLMCKGQMGESITRGLGSQGQLHEYNDCFNAEADRCGYVAYYQWWSKVFFKNGKHCWECGLSQRICRRMETKEREKRRPCEYAEVMLPSIFILHEQKHLAAIVEAVGFQGEYNSEDLWVWLNETAEGWGLEWESNWMKTWEAVCKKLTAVVGRAGMANEDWARPRIE